MRAIVLNEAKLTRYMIEWALAYTHYLEARRAMEACGRCEHEEKYDPENGDGTPRCYRQWSDITDEWCDPCRRRQPLFEEAKRRRRVTRESLDRLRRVASRSVGARTTNAVDPVAQPSGTPTTRVTTSASYTDFNSAPPPAEEPAP